MRLLLSGWHHNLKFSAAHLIPYHSKCGRIHGHTYGVSVELEGIPGSEGLVMDFGYIKDCLRKILKRLDHRLIVPGRNPALVISSSGEQEIEIMVGQKHYVFPRDDVVLLDIESSTAESLSCYLLEELRDTLDISGNISRISVGLDEGIGQGAWCSMDLPSQTKAKDSAPQ